MADLVRDAIAAELALLVAVTATPVAPFGYGSDLSCTSDLTETMDEVDGLTTLALAQALVRRLDCPRGAVGDDDDYGMDLRAMCNQGVAASDVRELASKVRSEIEKDDRVERCGVTVTPSSTGTDLRVELAVSAVDPAIGVFKLTLAVTSAAVLIEEMRSAA